MTKQYDEAYFQHWYRRSDIGGPQRLARKVAFLVGGGVVFCDRDAERRHFQSMQCPACGCRQHETI